MVTFDVMFDRTVTKNEAAEDVSPVLAEDEEEAATKVREAIEVRGDVAAVEFEPNDDEEPPEGSDEESSDESEYVVEKIDVVIEGKAPVKADSADEAKSRFLSQVQNTDTSRDTQDGSFEVVEIERNLP